MNNAMKIGEFIQTRRVEKALSRRALARLCGVNHSHLLRVERDETPVSPGLAIRLAPHLGCNPDYLQGLAGHFPDDLLCFLQQNPDVCLRLREEESVNLKSR